MDRRTLELVELRRGQIALWPTTRPLGAARHASLAAAAADAAAAAHGERQLNFVAGHGGISDVRCVREYVCVGS